MVSEVRFAIEFKDPMSSQTKHFGQGLRIGAARFAATTERPRCIVATGAFV